jgi:hypothetical protein
MGTATKPDTNTDPKTENGGTEKLARRTSLTPAQQAQIEERRAHSLMVQQIKGAVWAKEFDAYTIRAVAAWSQANDIDPVTEVDVLGGNIYINSRYYERILSRLIGAGQIDYARPDWVHVDTRLAHLAAEGDADAREESHRRQLARIEFNLHENADAACVYRIKHRLMQQEITGAKEHVPGRKRTIKKKDGSSFTVDADPIGDQAPTETIETRALRRAMLKLKEAFPDIRIASSRDDDTIAISDVLHSARDEVRANQAPERPAQALPPGDPYNLESAEVVQARGEPMTVEVEEVSDDDIQRQDQETLALDAQRERAK